MPKLAGKNPGLPFNYQLTLLKSVILFPGMGKKNPLQDSQCGTIKRSAHSIFKYGGSEQAKAFKPLGSLCTPCIITGTVKSSNTQWLLVMANITPKHICRQNTVQQSEVKIQNNLALPIHEDGITIPRPNSYHPLLARIKPIKNRRHLQPDAWKEEWKNDIPSNNFLVDNVHYKPSELDLPTTYFGQNRTAYVQARVCVTIYFINEESKQAGLIEAKTNKPQIIKKKFHDTLTELHEAIHTIYKSNFNNDLRHRHSTLLSRTKELS